MLINSNTRRNIFSDVSLWALLLSNIVTILFAIIENWNITTTLWVYVLQSIIIGIFNAIRISQLKEFSTEGLEINGQSTQPTKGTQKFTVSFFLFHYGLFHFVYIIFLLQTNTPNYVELAYILLTALFFFANHFFSYIYNRARDTKKQNIGSLMFYPYARIIPMHLILILGSSFIGTLPFFLVLKTLADATMHIVEHNVLRKSVP